MHKKHHYRELLSIGFPIIIGQLGTIILGFADTLMIGHHSTPELAAAGLVNNIFGLVFVSYMGFTYGLTPIIGRLYGEERTDVIGQKVRNSFLANMLTGGIFTLALILLYLNLAHIGQPEELLELIRPYYLVNLASVLFMGIFYTMKQFLDGIGQTKVAMWAMIGGNIVNILGNWAKTSLPWMSIGYETQIPPISTLTFYNTIANNGKMMRPRFVSKVVKNGETIMEFPPEVMREQIAKPQSIKKIQTILEQVVSVGLGKKAGSPNFKVAGKTGTAQVSKGAGGYKSGITNYLVSFAGYFPADNPRYSCIVCIQKSGLPASGGSMSGKVFHDIAEGIMAQSLKLDVKDAKDSASIFVPDVKNGNVLAANYVLTHLGIKTNTNWSGSYANGNPIWGKAERIGSRSIKLIKEKQYGKGTVPDITGMGARDAIFCMESRGIRTRIHGRGKVIKQSLMPGTPVKKGSICIIELN